MRWWGVGLGMGLEAPKRSLARGRSPKGEEVIAAAYRNTRRMYLVDIIYLQLQYYLAVLVVNARGHAMTTQAYLAAIIPPTTEQWM